MLMNYDSMLEDYFHWEYEAWVEISVDLEQEEREHFLPIDAVRSYFTTCDDKLQRNLDKILIEIFDSERPPINSDLILRDHIAVFCILLHIDRARYISHFIYFEDLSDQRLPFDLANPPQNFPSTKKDPKFLHEFCNIQKRYCVPVFDSLMIHKNFGSQRLLPIICKERLRTRGIATSNIITVYGPYNKIISESEKMKYPNANTFLLRSYAAPHGTSFFTRQINTFRSVKNANGITKFYGSFEHHGQSHILLEFADKGTLDEFFRNEAPPTRGNEIVNFWDNLLQLTRGLKAIHSVKESHNDICPENILVFSCGARSPSNWKFKFSDLGIDPQCVTSSKQTSWSDSTSDPRSKQTLNYTKSIKNNDEYQENDASRRADIWHLGFVLCQAAIWVADGYKGIVDFQQKLGDSVKIKSIKRFHGDKRLSEKIITAHDEIESNLRRSDHITKDVLDTLVEEMLWDDDKINAEALIQKADMIILKAHQTLAEVFSIKKSSRRRSQSQSTPRAKSPPPPLPILTAENRNQIPKFRPRGIQHTESWQTNFSRLSSSLSKNSFSIRGLENNCTNVRSVDLYSDNYGGNTSSEVENDIPATSWFLDSPTNDSPITPPTSISTKGQCYSQSSELDYSSNKKLLLRTSISLEQHQFTRSSQGFDIIPPLSKKKAQTIDENTDKNFEYEVHLPNVFQQLSSQESSIYYPLPPSRSQSSRFKNLSVGDMTPYPQQEPLSTSNSQHLPSPILPAPKPTLPKINPQARPHTGVDVIRKNSSYSASLENETYHHIWTLYNNSASSTVPEILVNSNDPSCSQSLNSSSASSVTNKSLKFGTASSIFSRSRLSLLNSRRYSELSIPRYSSKIAMVPPKSQQISIETPVPNKISFLDINTCRYWKYLKKTSKRKSKVPSLPEAYLLDPLHKRDHIFIVDDSDSMAPHWLDVCSVFEGLTYMVKGMSPLGTQLYFTISSSNFRSKATHDLCQLVFERPLQTAQTDLVKRLDLQLSIYRLKLWNPNTDVKNTRPISFYILSNGIWTNEWEKALRDTLEQTALVLNQFELKEQVFISFIGFNKNTKAARTIESLSNSDWGGGLSIRWSWCTGNVWGMLRGDLVNTDHISSDLKICDDSLANVRSDCAKNLELENSVYKDDHFKGFPISRQIEGLFELA